MISETAADFFARSPVLIFPVIALAIFVAVFTVVSIRAFMRSTSELDALSQLPLEDDTHPHEDS